MKLKRFLGQYLDARLFGIARRPRLLFATLESNQRALHRDVELFQDVLLFVKIDFQECDVSELR